MKLSKEELEEYIITQIKDVIINEGVKMDDKLIKQILSHLEKEFSKSDQNIYHMSNEELLNIRNVDSKEDLNESFSVIKPEDIIENVEEVKKLNEEFKRMRHLVDFRSPLLMKD